MSDLIGKTLGPYRILEQIGVGGMATVYKAYQPSTDRDVAIKVLPHYLSQDAEFVKRFQREARAIAKLEHAHILPVYDYGEHNHITYIAMRYIQAGTLKERIAKGPLPLDEINRLIGQIGGALDYAHRMGVIHRDVKPGNVLVDAQGDTYLTDFGLARMMEATQQLTASGVGLGTPAYMSPEQGQGVKVDHRSDIYSLGVVLYEMVTGHVPYEAETPMGVVLKHISDPLPLPRKVAPNVPEAVEKVILRALAKDPAHRFQTAGEMVEALNIAAHKAAPEPGRPVVAGAAPGAASISFVARVQRAWEKPRGKFALISGTLVILTVLGLLLGRLPGSVAILGPGPALSTVEGAALTATSASVAQAATPFPTRTPLPTQTPGPTATTGPTNTSNPLAQGERLKMCTTGTDLCIVDGGGKSTALGLAGDYLNFSGFGFSPNGSQIVFTACSREELQQNPDHQFCHDLFITGREGADAISLLPSVNVPETYPSWSPDGEWAAFGGWSFSIIRTDGTGLTTLVSDAAVDNVHASAWSPDSQRLAFVAGSHSFELNWGFQNEVSIINRDGSDRRMIFYLPDPKPAPEDWIAEIAWSPDGQSVAVQFDDGRTYLIDADCEAGSIGCQLSDLTKIPEIPPDWLDTFYPQWGGEAQTAILTPQAEQARTFTNPNDFQAATSGLGTPTIVDFEDIDAKPVSDTFKGRKPFDGATYASRGIAFASPYETPLFIAPGGLFWNASNSLSVGQFPNDANARKEDTDDDLTIRLNPPAIAVGFALVDLSTREATHVTWLDASGAVVAEIPLPNNYENEKDRAFVGIVSPNRPIATIRVDEGLPKDEDDVNYDDFIFIPASTSASQTDQARAFAEPILQAIANRKPDVADDFSADNKEWRWDEPNGSSVAIKDGVLNMNTTHPYPDLWATHELFAAPDFALQLEFVPKATGSESQVSFNFRDATPEPATCALSFTPRSGAWYVFCGTAGSNVFYDQGTTEEVEIESRTRLLLIGKGSEFAIYLNDKPFTYFRDDARSHGRIAIGLNSRASSTEVEFDNVKFWNLANVPELP